MIATTTTIRIGAKQLSAALARLLPLVQDSPILPAYSSVLLFTNYVGELMLTAGGESQRMTLLAGSVEIDGGDSFSCCPEITPLARFVATLGDIPVWLTQEGEMLTVATATVNASFPCFPATDYPAMETPDQPVEIYLSEDSSQHLAGRLARASEFMGSNVEFAPYFAGVWLSPHQGYLRLEACDSFFGTDEVLPLEWPLDKPVLLAGDKVKPVVNFLEAGSCTLAITPAWIGVSGEANQLWVRRLTVTYPNFAGIWPQEGDLNATWTVDRSQLIGALRRIQALPGLPVKTGATHVARLLSNEGDPELTYSQAMRDYTAQERVGDWEGDELEWACGIDVKHLLTLASSYTSPELFIQLNASDQPRRFLFIDDRAGNARSMQMALLV